MQENLQYRTPWVKTRHTQEVRGGGGFAWQKTQALLFWHLLHSYYLALLLL